MERFNVLSLFDGGSMAYPAIIMAGVPERAIKYYAVELDPYARIVGDHRVHNLVRPVNDVQLLSGYNFPQVDLLIAGSPCTSLSIAKRQKESGLYKGESMLFWEFVRIWKESKPKYWLLENVASMKASDRDIITETLGVEPIFINSSKLSAQSRKRYYWTNIPNVEVPEDKGIILKDILESGDTDRLKSYCVTATYNRACAQDYFLHGQRQMVFDKPVRVATIGKGGQGERVYHSQGKSVTLSANGGGRGAKTGLYEIKGLIRKLTPLECERLQTLPDGWTDVGLSDAQRYKIIGNGFTVDVIAHILSYIPELNENADTKRTNVAVSD